MIQPPALDLDSVIRHGAELIVCYMPDEPGAVDEYGYVTEEPSEGWFDATLQSDQHADGTEAETVTLAVGCGATVAEALADLLTRLAPPAREAVTDNNPPF